MSRGRGCLLATALSGLTLGCGADDVIDEVGCELTADLVATLGSLDDSLSVVSGQLAQVVPMANGWAVLDRGGTVLRYDAAGRLLGRLGREGDGPEELRRPMTISAGPADSVWVADSQGRWVIFAPDGTPVRTVSGGNRPIDGFTPTGVPFKLYAAGLLQSDGTVHASLYVRRWSGTDSTNADPADRVGPGTAALDRGARTGPAAAGSLVTAVSDTTFLVVGNWGPDGRPTDVMPGEAGVMRWTPSSSELWASSRSLSAAVRRFGLTPELYIIPRGIEADADGDGYWLIGGVRRVSEREMEAEEEELGGASWQSQPSFKNGVFDGAFWHLDDAGRVTGAGFVEEYPEGMAGPGHFFSIAEDDATGLRTIQVYRMPRPCEAAPG